MVIFFLIPVFEKQMNYSIPMNNLANA